MRQRTRLPRPTGRITTLMRCGRIGILLVDILLLPKLHSYDVEPRQPPSYSPSPLWAGQPAWNRGREQMAPLASVCCVQGCGGREGGGGSPAIDRSTRGRYELRHRKRALGGILPIACILHSTAPVPLMQVPAQGKNAGMVGGPDTDA